MQYLSELLNDISCPIRLQWFDFEENIDDDKWSNIFKIASKLPWLKWNDLCVLII